MNTNKLDKLVDQIFSEMGEIEQGRNGLLNERGELICFKLIESFRVTDNVPHLDMLRYSLDVESFKYVMDQVGSRLMNLYTTKQDVSYDEYYNNDFLYNYRQ